MDKKEYTFKCFECKKTFSENVAPKEVEFDGEVFPLTIEASICPFCKGYAPIHKDITEE